jgi:SpoVK/Ycf46/Vps4 family AAA+-type ATPase
VLVSPSRLDAESIQHALKVFRGHGQSHASAQHRPSNGTTSPDATPESAIERILDAANLKRSDLNSYEKKLLSNVLPAEAIRVRFQNIACLRKTKETLQSLIALPLLRPSFFQQGVLRDTVSGVLMFGPPGMINH